MFDIYGDENAQNGILVEMLRRDGVSYLTSNEAGNGGKSDPEQLAFAAAHFRVFLTFDRVDFQRLYAEWARRGLDHAGIIILTRSDSPPGCLAPGHYAPSARPDSRRHAERDTLHRPIAN